MGLRAWLGLQGSGSLMPRTNHGSTYDISEIDEFWICLKSSIPINLLEFGGWTQVSILLNFPFALSRNLDLEFKIVQMNYPSQDEKIIVIRRDYLHYVRKFKRFEKRQTSLQAHCSPCLALPRPFDRPWSPDPKP